MPNLLPEEYAESVGISRNGVNAAITEDTRRKLLAILLLIIQESAGRISNGIDPIAMDSRTLWALKLAVGQTTGGMQAYEMGVSSAIDVLIHTGVLESGTTVPSISTYFLEDIKFHFQEQARIQADTIIKKIKNKEQSLRMELDEQGNPIYPENNSLSTKFYEDMKLIMETYAGLVAQTGAVWASNEGVMRGYSLSGVRRMYWHTMLDERVCPFCNEMHGTIVNIGTPFVHANADLTVTDGEVDRTLTMPAWDIMHPPLHVNCRCILLPIAES